jgi:hypothetical protein
MKAANVADLDRRRDELERGRADGRRAALENGRQRSGRDGTLVEQSEHADQAVMSSVASTSAALRASCRLTTVLKTRRQALEWRRSSSA